MVEGGVQAIFGPSDYVLGMHIDSICDSLEIPHLKTGPDLDLEGSTANENVPGEDGNLDVHENASSVPIHSGIDISPGKRPLQSTFSQANPRQRRSGISLYPAQHLINAALLDVVQYLNWTRVAIVFEENEGILFHEFFYILLYFL